MKSAHFWSIKAQNAVNPFGLTSILTKSEQNIRLFKTGSDYSSHLKVSTLIRFVFPDFPLVTHTFYILSKETLAKCQTTHSTI